MGWPLWRLLVMQHLYHKPLKIHGFKSPFNRHWTRISRQNPWPMARLTRIHLWRCQVLGNPTERASNCLLSEKGEHDDNFVELGEIPDIQSYFLDGLVEKNEDATWFFTTKRVQTWRQPQKIGCFGTEQWRKGADAKHSFTNFTDPTVLNPSGTSGLIFSGWGAPVVHRLPAVMNSSSSFGVLHSS
jgi:hypothetical protein